MKNLIYNVWFWIAIGELLIIIVLLFARKRKSFESEKDMKAEFLSDSENIDFGNLTAGFFQAKPLYDLLKVHCHPDRFTDPEQNRKATAFFQQINENRYNYKKLCELKQQVINELGIKV